MESNYKVKTIGNQEIFYVPISSIILTQPIFDELVKNSIVPENVTVKNIESSPCVFDKKSGKRIHVPLKRICEMKKLFESDKFLPPILVNVLRRNKRRKRRVKRNNNNDNLIYDIIDGRHRVTCSYLMGYTRVPVIIERRVL